MADPKVQLEVAARRLMDEVGSLADGITTSDSSAQLQSLRLISDTFCVIWKTFDDLLQDVRKSVREREQSVHTREQNVKMAEIRQGEERIRLEHQQQLIQVGWEKLTAARAEREAETTKATEEKAELEELRPLQARLTQMETGYNEMKTKYDEMVEEHAVMKQEVVEFNDMETKFIARGVRITNLERQIKSIEEDRVTLKKQMDRKQAERGDIPEGSRKRPRQESDPEPIEQTPWLKYVASLNAILQRCHPVVDEAALGDIQGGQATVFETIVNRALPVWAPEGLAKFLDSSVLGVWYCFRYVASNGPGHQAQIQEGGKCRVHEKTTGKMCIEIRHEGGGRIQLRGRKY